MDDHRRQNPAYRPASEKPPRGGFSISPPLGHAPALRPPPLAVDVEEWDEDMGQRTDPEGVGDGADADDSPEEPPGQKHTQLEAGAHDADRVAARRDAGHEPVTWAGAEIGSDVGAGRHAVQEDAHHHREDA